MHFKTTLKATLETYKRKKNMTVTHVKLALWQVKQFCLRVEANEMCPMSHCLWKSFSHTEVLSYLLPVCMHC